MIPKNWKRKWEGGRRYEMKAKWWDYDLEDYGGVRWLVKQRRN